MVYFPAMKNIFLLLLFFTFQAFAADQLSSECQEFIANLPANIEKGFITVPENWDQPDGRQINVFYYGKIEEAKASIPIAFFNGGPSASSHGSYEVLDGSVGFNKLPLIYIDQRGNGCSDSYPQGNDLNTALRISNYTTSSIVKDAEAIRKKLFGENTKWKIFGQSYGGMIVQRYVSMFPESLISAHAHGYSIMSDQADWMKYRILSQKRVLEDYFKIHPEDREGIVKLRSFISKDTCFESEDGKICGPDLSDGLIHSLGFQNSWDFLHYWIEQLPIYSGPELFNAYLDDQVSGFMRSSFANLIINRIEIGRGRSDAELCSIAISRLKSIGDDPMNWPINECRILLQVKTKYDSIVESINILNELKIEDVKSALLKNPNLKFYLYSGQKDVFVPEETFSEEVEKLKGLINYTNFENSGHEGFHTESKVLDDLISQ